MSNEHSIRDMIPAANSFENNVSPTRFSLEICPVSVKLLFSIALLGQGTFSILSDPIGDKEEWHSMRKGVIVVNHRHLGVNAGFVASVPSNHNSVNPGGTRVGIAILRRITAHIINSRNIEGAI